MEASGDGFAIYRREGGRMKDAAPRLDEAELRWLVQAAGPALLPPLRTRRAPGQARTSETGQPAAKPQETPTPPAADVPPAEERDPLGYLKVQPGFDEDDAPPGGGGPSGGAQATETGVG